MRRFNELELRAERSKDTDVSDPRESRRAVKERRQNSQQLIRQWAVFRLLSESGREYSAKELADQLGASKASIERDLKTLEEQFALEEVRAGKQKKLYRIHEKLRALEGIKFSAAELFAIYAADATFASLSETLMHDDLRSVVRKIRGFLAPEHNGAIDTMSRVFAPHRRGHVDYAPHGEHIDSLAEAIARRRVCKLEYHAAWKGTTREHEARPLRLVSHRSALYLFACLGDHDRITTLAVHRILNLEDTKRTFVMPRIDVDAYVAKAFGIFVSDQEEDVEILFDAEIAWRVMERTFHPAERKNRRPDGVLQYQVRSSAQWEIVPWVQSFGSRAELIAPRSWREAARASAEAMLARYRE